MKSKILQMIWIIFGAGLLLGALASFIPTTYFVPELFAHFQFQFLVTGLGLLFFMLCLRQKSKLSYVLILMACTMHLWNIAPYLKIKVEQPIPKNAVTLLQANVFKFNTDPQLFINAIYQENPDVIVLFENTVLWKDALFEMEKKYPHYIINPEEGSHGIAIYSKYPILSDTVLMMSGDDVPSLKLQLEIKGAEVDVFLVHPLPPTRQAFFENKNDHLAGIANLVAEQKGERPLIVVGDLNTTMFGPYYKKMIRETGLKNARFGRGLMPSWTLNDRQFLGLPIDHFLSKGGITVYQSKVLPPVGSDHLPILTRFRVEP